MPNWCYTSLTIRGSKQDLEGFLQAVTLPESDEGGAFDLTLPFPTPKELAETVSGWSPDPETQAEYQKKYDSNLAKYGYKDWYDWNVANWGTKWSPRVDDLDLDEYNGSWSLSGRCDTAWSPATKLFTKLSELFPTLVFFTTFDEESQAYVGAEIYYQGKVYGIDFDPSSKDLPGDFPKRWLEIQAKFENGDPDHDAFQDLLDYQSDLTEVAERLAQEKFDLDFPSVLV